MVRNLVEDKKMDYKKALAKQLLKSNGRKIVLISEGILGNYLRQTFEVLGVELDVYLAMNEMGGVLPEKFACKKEEYFILVAIYSGHKKVVEELTQNGYIYDVDCAVTSASVYVDELDMIDPLLGYTRECEVCPGIVTYGKERDNNDLSILILGNSTTDNSVGNLNCWGYYLFLELSKLCRQNVVVYNGGVSGYHSGQEFLKLCRDGLDLKPDIVISFSGITDIEGIGTTVHGRKLLQKYQWRMWNNILNCPGAIPDSLHLRNLKKMSTGMKENLNDAEVWIKNERKMYAICQEFDVKFFGCLQPMIAEGCILENKIKLLLDDMEINEDFYSSQRKFISTVKEKMVQFKYLKDFSMLFNGLDDVYYDSMHYSERGNQIIARAVADIVIGNLNN